MAEDSYPLKQLNFRLRVHIRDNVVEILKVLATDFFERGRKLL